MNDVLLYGATASLAAGLATGVGALPAIFMRRISERVLDGMLGFAAGVMLAATSFSLIAPGIEFGTETLHWRAGAAVAAVVGGMLFGAVFLDRSDKWIPHEHVILGHEGPSSSLKKTWLFILAITLHNFPEGLAVGVGYGGAAGLAEGTPEFLSAVANGNSLAVGIGLQNMPEGLAVAVALLREKYSLGAALLIALATGLVEPIGGLVGAGVVTVSQPILPVAMGFAAGAMLFVISDEIIPETHTHGYQRTATFGLIIGFCIMMAMDKLLG
ncbi:MAG: ZIP family metal transporter [Planctomycetes bacterium]|nr:ZIP family metal transporter [Planctomycetota bacterium]